jgi:hypothetical protein
MEPIPVTALATPFAGCMKKNALTRRLKNRSSWRFLFGRIFYRKLNPR